MLIVRGVERFLEVRVMGLAAEMAYYAVLSLLPLIGAIGVSLGFLERVIGRQEVLEAEAAILQAVRVVFSAEATEDVIAPLVEGLLRQERTGFALGGFLVSLFFASRIFRSAIDVMDTAYQVAERRSTILLWMLGMLFALCAVVVATTVLGMVVVGPLLGGGRTIANWLGFGVAFEVAWAAIRWPVVFAVATAFLALFYRTGPNIRNTWLESLPGAVFAMAGLIFVAVGFRIYIEATGLQSPEIDNADDAVAVALQVVGALMAVLFWLWLSSMAVLAGGVMNAELCRMRRHRTVRS
jgi:membrane protein